MNMHEELHAYVDGQMSDEEIRDFKQQLASNPDLQGQLDSIRNLKKFVATNSANLTCDDTWNSCTKRIAELEKVRRTEHFVGRYAWAICGTFAFIIAVAGVWHKNNAPQNVQNADFVKAIAGMGSRSTPPSADRQEMNRWLDGLLGKAREAIASDRLVVKDAAEGVVDGHRVSRLHLDDSHGDMWLLAFDDAVRIEGLDSAPEDLYSHGRLGALNCVTWNSMGHTFILSGDRGFEALSVAAAKVCTPSK